MSVFVCNNCQTEISGHGIKCIECPDIDLCLQCFSLGAEVGNHKREHTYNINIMEHNYSANGSNAETGGKKVIQYIQNSQHRRVTYSKRSRSLIKAAQELEIQTRCKVCVKVLPTWPNGKDHKYESEETVPAEEPAEASTAEVGPGTSAQLPTGTAEGRIRPVFRPSLKPMKTKKACRLCNGLAETTAFIGCSFLNSKTKKNDCSYWVHQRCIGIAYKRREQLAKLPFYCPAHYPRN